MQFSRQRFGQDAKRLLAGRNRRGDDGAADGIAFLGFEDDPCARAVLDVTKKRDPFPGEDGGGGPVRRVARREDVDIG